MLSNIKFPEKHVNFAVVCIDVSYIFCKYEKFEDKHQVSEVLFCEVTEILNQ